MDIFQELGKVQSLKERLNNIHRGFAIVYIASLSSKKEIEENNRSEIQPFLHWNKL